MWACSPHICIHTHSCIYMAHITYMRMHCNKQQHTLQHTLQHMYMQHITCMRIQASAYTHTLAFRVLLRPQCVHSLSHTQTPTHTNTYTQIRTSKISATHWHPLQHTSTHFYGIGRAVGGLCLHTQLYVCVHRYICIHKKRLHINIYIYTPGSWWWWNSVVWHVLGGGQVPMYMHTFVCIDICTHNV